MKIEVTPAQLEAIKKLTDDCASMIGCGEYDSDRIWSRHIRLIDRMLAKNGHQRDFYVEEVTDAGDEKL
ncbi:TPA: hypothetical protein N2N40_002430 [Citrobacter freundii]|nr:hypothetical protein [Citrobacter freundii]